MTLLPDKRWRNVLASWVTSLSLMSQRPGRFGASALRELDQTCWLTAQRLSSTWMRLKTALLLASNGHPKRWVFIFSSASLDSASNFSLWSLYRPHVLSIFYCQVASSLWLGLYLYLAVHWWYIIVPSLLLIDILLYFFGFSTQYGF